MRSVSRLPLCALFVAVGLVLTITASSAASLPIKALALNADAAQTAAIEIGGRWYRDDDYYDGYDDGGGYDGAYVDDEYVDEEEYDPPPPPARRIYRQAPPIVVYEPPVYGWISPPRPASCGEFRYWNGVRCADARWDPPYTGPR